jgi:glycosyltransferase involved in cell wall biosynthesis
MTIPAILFDLTEFLHDPQRSGIQRVCYEIVAHWPNTSELVPASVDRWARLVRLSPEVLDLYRVYFQASQEKLPAMRQRLRLAVARRTEVISSRRLHRYQGLLNATVFALPYQVEYYLWAARQNLSDRIFLFVHDMLPWTQPGLFTPGFGVNLSGYLRCLRVLPNISFNSLQTRDDTLDRVLRDNRKPGPVFPLGAHCLGSAPPRFASERRQFSVIGTLEPRKNHRAVLDAFERLWADGVNVELIFAGKIGWLGEGDRQRIERLKSVERRFQFLENLGDEQIAEVIRGSRATIYPAFCEGYGLPPLESLALGVPVIVTESIPSIAMLPPDGQLRLHSSNGDCIRHAVLQMLDDSFARRKTEEIRCLRLPTWPSMVQGVEMWIREPLRAIESETSAPMALAG